MIDIKWLIKNQDIYIKNIKKRESYNLEYLVDLEKINSERKTILQEIENLNFKKNEIAKMFSKLEPSKLEEKKEEAKNIRLKIQELEEKYQLLEKDLNDILSNLPNILDDSVPYKENSLENVQLSSYGNLRKFNFKIKDHLELGENIGMLDSTRASKVSGSRFMVSSNLIAKMERALVSLFLDHCIEYGYKEYSLPFLISSEGAFKAGQLPKFEEDIFKTTDGKYLISTSEMFIANLYSDEFINNNEFPIRICASTACFRKEAGSAGKDTKGLIRLHQFQKVETFCIVEPEKSELEHERMVGCIENLLQKLELPYRKMLLCAQDTGFCASKTYDLEVWFPSQNEFREIASCSNTKDFQSRRANVKFKKDGKNEFVHMLNGSCLPIGRTLACIIENYQNEDGSFDIPKVLIPYMNNITNIGK